jgi:ABC-type polysaccharide/polyol phosphate transport system ATPase subunit
VNAVEFHAVSKTYPVYASPGDRLKELATLNRKPFHEEFWALSDVSFEARRGEVFCIVGENGAGKSTLLQLIAGILQPASGTIHVAGRVAALLDLGAGFNPEFTGRDNVYLNGAILGFSKREIDARYPQIESFAEIGDFILRPVKTYSSGMVVRLAFAVAIHAEPDILLVDEALSVGDAYFRQRCMRKVHELRSRGVTIIFVSHSIADVKAIGDRTLWLEHGRVRRLGDSDSVVDAYLSAMAQKDAAYLHLNPSTPEAIEGVPNIDHRHGNGRAEVIGIAVLDSQGRPAPILEPSTPVVLRITVRAILELLHPIVAFTLRNHLGIDFAGTDTAREGLTLPSLRPAETCTVDFRLDLPQLYPAFFSFSAAVADGALEQADICDCIDNAVTVQMAASDNQIYGYIHLPCRVHLNTTLSEAIAEAEVD